MYLFYIHDALLQDILRARASALVDIAPNQSSMLDKTWTKFEYIFFLLLNPIKMIKMLEKGKRIFPQVAISTADHVLFSELRSY